MLKQVTAILLVVPSIAFSQIEQWEPSVTLSIPNPPSLFFSFSSDMVSDGAGNHLVVMAHRLDQPPPPPPPDDLWYYRFDNNGNLLNSYLLRSGAAYPAVTSFGGKLHLAFLNPGTSLIELHESVDRGDTWNLLGIKSPGGELRQIDSYEDTRGIHIVAGGLSGVKYYMWDRILVSWAPYSEQVTSQAAFEGATVVATQDSVHVYSYTAMRSLSFAGNTWTGNQFYNPGFRSGKISTFGDNIHVIPIQPYEECSQIQNSIHSACRLVSGGNWSTPIELDHRVWTFGSTWNAVSTIAGGMLRVAYTNYQDCAGLPGWVTYRQFGSSWGPPEYVTPLVPSIGSYSPPQISSNLSSVVVAWFAQSGLTEQAIHIRRRPIGISGTVTVTYDFTGNNWVTDDLTIQAGVQVNLKPGSVTYVSDNKRIIVQNGARFIQEPGSQIVWGSGAKYQLNTNLLSSWNMTGIPVVVPDFHKAVVYPNAISDAYACIGSSSYTPTDPLNNYQGWYIRFGPAQPIAYEGDFIDDAPMIAGNGWNIIGSISSPIATRNVYSTPGGIIVPYYFKFDNGYIRVDTLKPGGGYWVKTTAAGSIVLDVQSNIEGEQQLAFQTYDKFTLLDAAGGSQELYIRNGTLVGSTDNIEMPPPPPDVPFDVRFSSGDFLRTVIPDSAGIDLSIVLNAVTYPAELSWKINPENGLTYVMLPDSGNGLGKGNSTKSIRGSSSLLLSRRGDGFIRFNVSNRQVEESDVPSQFALQQNYPNPFNPSTTISYDLPIDSKVTLKVFDVLGREVATLVDGFVGAGYHQATLNATNLASGLYFYRMQAGSFISVKRMVLVK